MSSASGVSLTSVPEPGPVLFPVPLTLILPSVPVFLTRIMPDLDSEVDTPNVPASVSVLVAVLVSVLHLGEYVQV